MDTNDHKQGLWRWRDSNPRPRASGWVFYGRSRRSDLTARVPPAEELAASPAEMSDGGHRAKPPPSACSRRPTRRGRRPAADGYLIVVRQRAPFCRHLFWSRLLTRHPGTSARFPQAVPTQVEASSPPYAVASSIGTADDGPGFRQRTLRAPRERSISRRCSRSAMAWRFSNRRLPRPRPSSILASPRVK